MCAFDMVERRCLQPGSDSGGNQEEVMRPMHDEVENWRPKMTTWVMIIPMLQANLLRVCVVSFRRLPVFTI
jgi:hypothetical protein